MSDEWEETDAAGKSFGQSYCKNDNQESEQDASQSGFRGRGRGGGRGGRGGRNGFGSSRNYDNENGDTDRDPEDNGYDNRNERGGFRGRGRGRGGGSRGFNNGYNNEHCDRDRDDNDYGNNGNEERGGFRGRGRGRGRGGRGGGRGGFSGGDDNGDDNGYRPRGGDNDFGGDDVDQIKTDKPRELYIPPAPTEDEDEIFGSSISSGINFDKFDEIKINVTGENPPKPIVSFAESGLRDYLLGNVRKSKYTKPTPIQKHAIPIIMDKRDLMACAQTGSGKTAAFLLPMINTLLNDNDDMEPGHPFVVIIGPTRELVIQIFEEARKFSLGTILKVCVAYGGTASRHQMDTMANGCHILVATPGRLIDFVDRQVISFAKIKFVVLDEADRMLDMGFMSSIEKVMNHETMRPNGARQTLMFSATFPAPIQELAGQFLDNYIFIAIGIVGGASSDVDQVIYEVKRFQKRKKLEEILEAGDPKGTIVFVETKRNADYLASLLSETKFPTTSIHGDRLQREREEALRDFKSGKMFILIATSVAARGLDIKNVAHVINYDLPKSIDDYVHRIGRTGRVGNKGKATSFYDPEMDSALGPDLVRILTQADQEVPDFLQGMGGGGGGGFSGSNQFGGRDIRDAGGSRVDAQPTQLEPEDEWA
ncbi:ATP-dependent RNA helicase vasa-like [Sabethes cyaneus]|uniref:ATP-dependent RNA helicase vasa-like n=1 Tax=Sabethes cyaneus TaxID=53552 RepID=UPI00237DC9AD|nr:ATP-dependent RNA helicase vasa-like [Sabethes cyaneus]